MTERASDLLTEVADRLSDKATESGLVAAESVRAIEPELLKIHKDGTVDELVKTSVAFLEILFRSLRPDSRVPWHEYYSVAREASRRYAEKGDQGAVDHAEQQSHRHARDDHQDQRHVGIVLTDQCRDESPAQ